MVFNHGIEPVPSLEADLQVFSIMKVSACCNPGTVVMYRIASMQSRPDTSFLFHESMHVRRGVVCMGCVGELYVSKVGKIIMIKCIFHFLWIYMHEYLFRVFVSLAL